MFALSFMVVSCVRNPSVGLNAAIGVFPYPPFTRYNRHTSYPYIGSLVNLN